MARKAKPGAGAKKRASGTHLPVEELVALQQSLDSGGPLDLSLVLRFLGVSLGSPDSSPGGKAATTSLKRLIPDPGKHRQKGLWAKDAVALAHLGPDPAEMQRGDLAVPVGLVNLGSTCYANAVLQTLYAIPPFRQALYAARPPLSQDPVVAQLRELFACMEWGRRDPLDPGPLVAALQLDHAVQQDGQEFMKLFLGLLEARFQAQNPLDALLRHLFRGESGYETRCCRCGRASASSGRREGYYELAVPVSGFQTLPESLTSLLAPETLSGSNSLACEYCGTKTEAERQLRLASTPPLLCISLQRFVFDYRKMDRVKINEALACPLTLDFGSILSPDQGAAGGECPRYTLAALMLHKGSAARAGHYVAHVNHSMFSSQYPAGSSAWWRFDDTAVSALASGPRASSDHGSALALQAANAKLPPEVAAGSIASCTAYQLLYRREDAVLPSVALSEAAEAWIDSRKAEAAAEGEASLKTYVQAKTDLLQRRGERQAAIQRLLKAADPVPESDAGCFVNVAWLRRFCDAEPGSEAAERDGEERREGDASSATNSLLCGHGSLDPEHVASGARLVSSEAFGLLCDLAGPCRRLGPADICRVCLGARLQGIAAQADAATQREWWVQQASDALARADGEGGEASGRGEEDASSVYVSRAWLSGYVTKRGRFSLHVRLSTGGGLGTEPFSGVLCPHGLLLPERQTGSRRSRRVAVPEPLWARLADDWMRAWKERETPGEGEDGSPPALPPPPACFTPECQQCLAESESLAAASRVASQQRQPARSVLACLTEHPPPLREVAVGEALALVPAAFMHAWRAWVKGKESEPPSLAEAMEACLEETCLEEAAGLPETSDARPQEADLVTEIGSAERGLAVEPPKVVVRRGKFFVPAPAKGTVGDPGFELLSLENWQQLANFHDLPEHLSRGFNVTLQRGLSEATHVNNAETLAEASPVGQSEGVEWVANPPVSQAAVQRRRERHEASLLSYEAAEISVRLVPAEEGPRSDDDIDAAAVRASKRTRRDRVVLTLASTTTLQVLRGHVYQALGVHPGNAQFYLGSRRLQGSPDETLASMRIFPGSCLKVVDTGEHAADDLASLIPASAHTSKKEEGAGFGGTVLASS
ncbi:hypothetical protein ACKKBG_A08100 [Auxenochlorella protothecoides x Auxenochlorella symbiontica]